MKELPMKINEQFLQVNRISIKFKGLNKTYASKQDDYCVFSIKECNLIGNQFWIAFRIKINEYGKDCGFLDVDIYLPKNSSNIEKIRKWIDFKKNNCYKEQLNLNGKKAVL